MIRGLRPLVCFCLPLETYHIHLSSITALQYYAYLIFTSTLLNAMRCQIPSYTLTAGEPNRFMAETEFLGMKLNTVGLGLPLHHATIPIQQNGSRVLWLSTQTRVSVISKASLLTFVCLLLPKNDKDKTAGGSTSPKNGRWSETWRVEPRPTLQTWVIFYVVPTSFLCWFQTLLYSKNKVFNHRFKLQAAHSACCHPNGTEITYY